MRRLRFLRFFSICLLLVPCLALAGEDHPDYELGPEPPHRKAELQSGYGDADFPITCQRRLSQLYFNQAVAMLHGFDVQAANQSFHSIVVLEPDCAMAYWGMAMASFDYPQRARQYLQQALTRKQQASAREQEWIEALDASLSKSSERESRAHLAESFRAIARAHPTDLEAKAFYVRQVVDNGLGGQTADDEEEIQESMQQILDRAPRHPIEVSRALFWSAKAPQRARESADTALRIAPKNPLVWSLAGRLHVQDGRYAEAAACFQKASRLFYGRMQRNHLMPDDIRGYANVQDLLVQSLANVGRVREAVALAWGMARSPCSSASDVDRFLAPDPNSHRIKGTQRLVSLLTDFELWRELEIFAGTARFLGEAGDIDLSIALARSALARGKLVDSEDRLARLRYIYAGTASHAYVFQGHSHDNSRAAEKREYVMGQRIQRVRQGIREVLLQRALTEGDHSALREMLERREPPPDTWSAPFYWAIEDRDKALYAADYARQYDPGRALVLARCAEFYKQAGDTKQAASLLKKLAATTELASQNLPICRRLDSLHQAASPSSTERHVAKVRPHPPADTFTPELELPIWRPYNAPDLTLPDKDGKLHSLEEYRGRPVLVIFFLGSGCPHCIEQLQALGPAKRYFDELGVSIVTVSTDSVEGVRDMYSIAGADEALPFLMVSDQPLKAFSDFSVIDELRQEPLHGCFLIDPQGRVRWQQTSSEPFMSFGFLWREVRALLSVGNNTTDLLRSAS